MRLESNQIPTWYSENYAVVQNEEGEFILAAYCVDAQGKSAPYHVKWSVDKSIDVAHNLSDIEELHKLLGEVIDNAKASSNNLDSLH